MPVLPSSISGVDLALDGNAEVRCILSCLNYTRLTKYRNERRQIVMRNGKVEGAFVNATSKKVTRMKQIRGEHGEDNHCTVKDIY